VSKEVNTIDIAGKKAGFLSLIEIGLGSVLHGFKVPFTGYFLSLNQGFFLARSVIQTKSRRLPFIISNVVAILKSLSPAGSRLTPMLAISAQGFFFSLGTVLFGANFVGVTVGYILLSLWSFFQPILIYYILFGKNIMDVGLYFYKKLSRVFTFEASDLLWILGSLIAIKILFSIFLSILAFRISEKKVAQYETRMIRASRIRRRRVETATPSRSWKENAKASLKDLFNPLFIISLIFTASFFFIIEASHAKMIWTLMRPLAIGFILFFLIRMISFEQLILKLEAKGFHNFSGSFRQAIDTVKKI